jgi:hypothetical protein
MRASAAAERSGLRTVSIVTEGFARVAASAAAALGGSHFKTAEYPGSIEAQDDDVIVRNVVELVLPQVIDGLTQNAHRTEMKPDPTPSDRYAIVMSGTLDDIHEAFHRRMWTDGLPIIPPTPGRVEAFLEHSLRSRDEVLAVLPPSMGEATVWSVAVNGVMAGCRPEYMPALEALVEAVADPKFRLQDAGSTPGWETLVVINGPIRHRIGLNFAGGLMRPGRQANTSLGRFVRLYLRNAAGLRTPPGEHDKASIGSPFNVAIAENDEACRELGWPTLAEIEGYRLDDDVVTVQSVVLSTPPIYTTGARSADHLRGLADVIARSASPWTVGGLRWGGLYAMIVTSPYIAAAIAKDGIGKLEAARYLQAEAKTPLGTILNDITRTGGNSGIDLQSLVAAGSIPEVYASAAFDAAVPVFPWVDGIRIVIAGDEARNQSRAYVSNHVQGSRVSKRIRTRPA